MTDGYAKILEQQKAMQAQVGKMHTHLMANSRVTSVILPVVMFAGGIVALSRGMYQLYTGALVCPRRPELLACHDTHSAGTQKHCGRLA